MSGHFCTIIAKNYVAQARVLAESYLRHNPRGKFSVLFVDDPEPYVDPEHEPYEVITPDALGFANYERMAAIYDVVELSTAVKPWLLKHLLARPDASTVTYLDPDIEVFDDLGEIVRLAEEHGLVLIPHLTAPLPQDGRKPGDSEILTAGTYNLGFISVGQGREGEALLDWWAEHLENECLNDPARGFFVDQRWIDLIPGWVPDLHILRDPGYNVAYWNLPSRTVERDGDSYLVNGRPLRFFHYSGYDPLRRDDLSRHQNRIDLRSEPVLRELFHSYAQSVLDHGYEEATRWRYGWEYLPDGSKLDRWARRLYRDGVMSGRLDESPFSRRGAKALVKHLNEPSDAPGGGAGVTRYMRAIYDSRPDLRSALPTLTDQTASAFIGWLTRSPDIAISPAFLGQKATGIRAQAPSGNGVGSSPRELRRAGDAGAVRPRSWGVNVTGYLTAELGVGEAARQMITALDARGIPVAPLGLPVEASRMEHEFEHMPAQEGPFAVNVICVNADMLPHFAEMIGPGFFTDRHSAGLWFWEVNQFPERWMSSFEHLDEVWTASRHVADAVGAVAPIPVHHIRLPVVPVPPADKGRAALGLPEGFCFLFVFDHNSVLERKNPLGLIEAFRLAFPAGSGPSLVLKTINGERHPEDVRRIRAAVAEHPDVHLIEGYVEAAEKSAMIASCDCYVSLHRSEGFGLTMAEAMYFGKPVIATGYSGNLDFMSAENSFLVEHSLRPIGEGAPPYPPDGEWADPDLDHAAALMRQVYEDREAAEERGRRGADEVRSTHSPETAGEVISGRLEPIRAELDGAGEPTGRVAEIPARSAAIEAPASEPLALGFARATYLVEQDSRPPMAGGNPLRRLARRLGLLVTKPARSHQHAVNRNLVAAISQLHDQVGYLQARDAGAEYAAAMAAFRKRDRELEGIRSELAARERHLAELQRTVADQSVADDDLRGRLEDIAPRLRRVEPEHTRTERWPAVTPWSHDYVAAHKSFIAATLDDGMSLERFARGARLPEGFGVGLDERVVEFPWLFAQPIGGEGLDAGSSLNHAHILERAEPLFQRLTIATLVSEAPALELDRVSYEDADLRELPYPDASFDTVTCISVLEHVGMDNREYGSDAPRASDPQAEALRAVRELRRVLRPGGRLLITVPYGVPEDLGWLRQLDRAQVEAVSDAAGPGECEVAVYRYGRRGWQLSDFDEAADARYRDFRADPRPVDDLAAAARAVACISLVAG